MTPEEAYNFIVNLGLSRDQRSEKIIMTDPEYAYRYARYVLKGRWSKAEPVIAKYPFWWDRYKKRFCIYE